jgi:hypothetical protein
LICLAIKQLLTEAFQRNIEENKRNCEGISRIKAEMNLGNVFALSIVKQKRGYEIVLSYLLLFLWSFPVKSKINVMNQTLTAHQFAVFHWF